MKTEHWAESEMLMNNFNVYCDDHLRFNIYIQCFLRALMIKPMSEY